MSGWVSVSREVADQIVERNKAYRRFRKARKKYEMARREYEEADRAYNGTQEKTSGKQSSARKWTRGEIYELCKSHETCDGCHFEQKNGGCLFFDEPPYTWQPGERGDGKGKTETTDKQHALTYAERAICRSMGAKYVTRDDVKYAANSQVFLWGKKPELFEGAYIRDGVDCLGMIADETGLFAKSVKPGECIKVEGAEKYDRQV